MSYFDWTILREVMSVYKNNYVHALIWELKTSNANDSYGT